jgi:hypothetical protein
LRLEPELVELVHDQVRLSAKATVQQSLREPAAVVVTPDARNENVVRSGRGECRCQRVKGADADDPDATRRKQLLGASGDLLRRIENDDLHG